MGGPDNNENFILNCADWKNIPAGIFPRNKGTLRLAPMTGGVENAGYHDEKLFYTDIINSCIEAGIALSVGDGTPDEKFIWGCSAVRQNNAKAAVFIKPYPDEKIEERIELSQDIAEVCGIDIDSYNIATMRNLVHLEKKTSEQLLKTKNLLNKKGIPFAVKGIFTESDIQMLREVKPDIAYVSNHGGRVKTEKGSTARFLTLYADEIRNYCNEIWVDGGIRNGTDMEKAFSYGVSTVLMGRPFITALLKKQNFLSLLPKN